MNFGDISYSLTIGALQSIRLNASGTAFEAFTPSSGGDMLKSENLSGLADYPTARSNLGLGSLATQSGTFSGTSSGTNTGDQFTATSASKILGRGSAGGAGAAEEITLGTGLAMTGTTLSVTVGGGDVLGPATNTANYIPQWNGADSKTLKNGIDPATLLTTSTGLKLDQTTPQAIINGSPIMEGIQFDTTPSTSNAAEGLLRWNLTDGTLDLGMDGGNVTQQIGQEILFKVRNVSGSTIPNGSVVYFSGRTGGRPNIYLAKGDAIATSCVRGITTTDITSPSDGFVTSFGYVRQMKTNYTGSGAWGTTWVEGDVLWTSKTVAGGLTNVEPAAPHFCSRIGEVGVVGGDGIGSISVYIVPFKNLENLSDINGTALNTDGQILSWHNTAGYFDFDKNINNYALLNSPTFTGTVILPTIKITGGTPGLGKVLTSDADGDCTWETPSGGGLSWGASISGTSGTGLLLTVGNSASASTIGQSIVIGNTQTNAVIGLNIDTGTSAISHTALNISALQTGTGNTNGALCINSYGSATQGVGASYLLKIGRNFNTNSSYGNIGIALYNEQNDGGGVNSGIFVQNNSTDNGSVSGPNGQGVHIYQNGAGGTGLVVYGFNNVNSSTNGLVNYTLSNTQSGATVMQKIDLGTSAQGHVGISMDMGSGSANKIGIKIIGNSYTSGAPISLEGYGDRGFQITGSYSEMIKIIQNGNYTAFTSGPNGVTGVTGVVSLSVSPTSINCYGLRARWSKTTVAGDAKSVDFSEISFVHENRHTTGTQADDYNVSLIKRTSVQNGAGGTFTAAGSVLKLENVATQTAGTLTDTTYVLDLQQGALTSTNFKKVINIAGCTLWKSDGTTANGNLSGTAGDICFNAGSNKPEYCTGTTNWTALV